MAAPANEGMDVMHDEGLVTAGWASPISLVSCRLCSKEGRLSSASHPRRVHIAPSARRCVSNSKRSAAKSGAPGTAAEPANQCWENRDCWGARVRGARTGFLWTPAAAIIMMVVQCLGQSRLDHMELLVEKDDLLVLCSEGCSDGRRGIRSRMTSGNVTIKRFDGILREGQSRDSEPNASGVQMLR